MKVELDIQRKEIRERREQITPARLVVSIEGPRSVNLQYPEQFQFEGWNIVNLTPRCPHSHAVWYARTICFERKMIAIECEVVQSISDARVINSFRADQSAIGAVRRILQNWGSLVISMTCSKAIRDNIVRYQPDGSEVSFGRKHFLLDVGVSSGNIEQIDVLSHKLYIWFHIPELLGCVSKLVQEDRWGWRFASFPSRVLSHFENFGEQTFTARLSTDEIAQITDEEIRQAAAQLARYLSREAIEQGWIEEAARAPAASTRDETPRMPKVYDLVEHTILESKLVEAEK